MTRGFEDMGEPWNFRMCVIKWGRAAPASGINWGNDDNDLHVLMPNLVIVTVTDMDTVD